jgi:hypothetical protein
MNAIDTLPPDIKVIADYLRTVPCAHDPTHKTAALDCSACVVMTMHRASESVRAELIARIEQTNAVLATSLEVAMGLLEAWPEACQFCKNDEKPATYIEQYRARDGSDRERLSCDEHAERYLTNPIKEHEVEQAPLLRKGMALMQQITSQIVAAQQAAAQQEAER